MLVLSRKPEEKVVISLSFLKEVIAFAYEKAHCGQGIEDICSELQGVLGGTIEVTYLGETKDRGRLAFQAHELIKIHRSELWERLNEEFPRIAETQPS
tara:strand:+ start:6923 stop:7216 length:294 start_codon:yes stop_codon:yes gene_type:complete